MPLFHKGYTKDSSLIAKEAKQYTLTQEYDVVLIDTTSCMQNNVLLTKALNKLVRDNNSDLVIFTCEARCCRLF